MSTLRRLRGRTKVAVLGAATLVFAVFGLASCGGGTTGQEGGSALFVDTGYPDYLDPQLSYAAEGWEAMWNTYIPLLTYNHAPGAAGSEVVPGLAKGLPKITDGGKTYTMVLRQGLKYSDGTPVKASDFEFAVKRQFDLNSPGSSFYTDIVGASDYQAGKADDISGVETNEKTGEIVIHLNQPRGTFINELALMFVAPVPPDTPAKDQTPSPPPATGPYEITKSEPGRTYVEEPNPQWAKNNAKLLPDLPDGHLDKITFEVVKNQSAQTTMVEQGKADFMINPPPTDRLPEVESRYGDRFRKNSVPSTYYFWMNNQKPPFDDLKVRQAVNYAIDPEALVRIYGGLLTPTQQIVPPTLPGYQKIELYPHDLDKAKQLIQQANPSDKDITVWTDDEDTSVNATQYYQDVLKQLGFNAKLKILNFGVYFDTIGNAKTPDLDTGWTNWLQDYPHPGDFLDKLFNGDNITPVHNQVTTLYDNPKVNAELNKLSHLPLSDEVEQRYAAVDKQIMEDASAAPFGNRELTTFVSDRIDFDKVYFNPSFSEDWTSFQLKK